ncbi:restriction endonuclease [Bacillus thuringiensis]|uniref:restriction endonuclease n=1 Tax=Bacillus thuringiensis TaxID=1428 RepID=UPI0011A11085|nr:restriction endonuclease [Bacillus thuringiensis]HDT6579452.1 restriction endonuclease [Bacillus cereus]
MSKKSAVEKLQEIEEQMKRLKQEEKELKRKAKMEEKKKQEQSWKQTGELAEKYFQIKHLSIEKQEQLFESISILVNEKIEKIFSNKQEKNMYSSEMKTNNVSNQNSLMTQ